MQNLDLDFFKNKKVFITGHTGFKGSWMSKILINLGAEVIGYALPASDLSLFHISKMDDKVRSVYGDIRDFDLLRKTFAEAKPEIVIHMAAQPLVQYGYKNPRYTYETNVMGTVNILECVRQNSKDIGSFLNITTDKVYENKEWEWGYRENEELGGHDPYSNSKACSEFVTRCYISSFFSNDEKAYIPISTARAGNVIGGGDFADNRIIPDCIRAAMAHKELEVRNPCSVRPYQHVLEALCAYLVIVSAQWKNNSLAGSYNIGPNEDNCVETRTLVEIFKKYWKGDMQWVNVHSDESHETHFLKLDCSKFKTIFNWKPKWNIEQAVKETVEWTEAWMNGEDVVNIMDEQIKKYIEK